MFNENIKVAFAQLLWRDNIKTLMGYHIWPIWINKTSKIVHYLRYVTVCGEGLGNRLFLSVI